MRKIHLQHQPDEKKSAEWNKQAALSTLCWDQRGERTDNSELVTCEKCLKSLFNRK